MNENISGKLVEKVRKGKSMITGRTGEQCVKMQSNRDYDTYNKHEKEDGGDSVSIYSFLERDFTFTRTIQVSLIICQ